MGKQGRDAEPDQPLHGGPERERPAPVRKLQQEIAPGLCDRQPPELHRRNRPEEAEVDLGAVDDLDGDALLGEVGPDLGDGFLHHLGRRRVVVPHVRCGGEHRDPLCGRIQRQLPRLVQRARSVVDPREHVRVEIDHAETIVALPCQPRRAR